MRTGIVFSPTYKYLDNNIQIRLRHIPITKYMALLIIILLGILIKDKSKDKYTLKWRTYSNDDVADSVNVQHNRFRYKYHATSLKHHIPDHIR